MRDQSFADVFHVLFDFDDVFARAIECGNVVRKWSAYTAKEEYARYNKSGISGHTHRRGVFEHTDWNGVHAWWEHGCLCDLQPEYVEDPNWQSGFLVVTWSEDRLTYAVEEVRIHEGATIFRGQPFSAQPLLKAVA